jgi:hypothetical protein
VITITAPEDFPLTQAKASVKLSENATIYPDPASVTDWDAEQQFVVIAHNGAQKTTYKYTVERSGIAHNGAVVLKTQADVDVFGQRGITFIDGYLIIGNAGGTDSITSLKPLATLKEVAYSLTLNATCAITSLEGLDNLEHVGGTLTVGQTYNSTLLHLETVTLPALKTAGNISIGNPVTIIVELPQLERVSKRLELTSPLYQLQLPSLQSAGSLSLNTNASTSLAQISLPALEEVNGNITLGGWGSVTKIDLPKLRKAGGLSIGSMMQLALLYVPKLEEVAGAISIPSTSLGALTELSFPSLKQAGTLTVSNTKTTLLEVPKLETIKAITLSNVSLNGLASFPALKTAETVSLSNDPNWTRVTIPAGVQRIGVLSISVTGATNVAPAEVDITGKNIGELRIGGYGSPKIIGNDEFHGTLSLSLYESFPTLEGFQVVDSLSASNMVKVHIAGIREIKRGVSIYSGATVEGFSMPDMETIGGNVKIELTRWHNEVGDSIKLTKLQSIGGNFDLMLNTATVKVLHCPELITIGGNFNLNAGYDGTGYPNGFRGFESLNFPRLSTIGGKLTITAGNPSYNYSNTQLINLNSFTTLASVKAIEITKLKALIDYSGLKKAFESLALPTDWITANNAYNPTYQDLLDGKWTQNP